MDTVDWLFLAGYVGLLYWVATTTFDPNQAMKAMRARLEDAKLEGKLNAPVRHERKRDKRSGNG